MPDRDPLQNDKIDPSLPPEWNNRLGSYVRLFQSKLFILEKIQALLQVSPETLDDYGLQNLYTSKLPTICLSFSRTKVTLELDSELSPHELPHERLAQYLGKPKAFSSESML